MTRIKPCPSSPFPTDTHKFKHVPVKDIVVGETLAVEEVAEELPQVRVVRFIVKPQWAAEVEVCRELSWREQRTASWLTPSNPPSPTMEPPQPFSSRVLDLDGTNTQLCNKNWACWLLCSGHQENSVLIFTRGNAHTSLFFSPLLQARGSKSQSLLKESKNAGLKNKWRWALGSSAQSRGLPGSVVRLKQWPESNSYRGERPGWARLTLSLPLAQLPPAFSSGDFLIWMWFLIIL